MTGLFVPGIQASKTAQDLGNIWMAEAAVVAGVAVLAPPTAPVAAPAAAIVGILGGLTYLGGLICNPIPAQEEECGRGAPPDTLGGVIAHSELGAFYIGPTFNEFLNAHDPAISAGADPEPEKALCDEARDQAKLGFPGCYFDSQNAAFACLGERFNCRLAAGADAACVEGCELSAFVEEDACFDSGSACFEGCGTDTTCQGGCIEGEDSCLVSVWTGGQAACNNTCGGDPAGGAACEATQVTCLSTRLSVRDACLSQADATHAACVANASREAALPFAYLRAAPGLFDLNKEVGLWTGGLFAVGQAAQTGDPVLVAARVADLDNARTRVIQAVGALDTEMVALSQAFQDSWTEGGVGNDLTVANDAIVRFQNEGLGVTTRMFLTNALGYTPAALDVYEVQMGRTLLVDLTPDQIANQGPPGTDWPARGAALIDYVNRETDVTLFSNDPRIDVFANTIATMNLRHPDGTVEPVELTGSTTVEVVIGPNGEDPVPEVPFDTVDTEMVALSLSGISSLGPVDVTLRLDQRTLGTLTERTNLIPGTLEVRPYVLGTFQVDSFFDVFYDITVEGIPPMANLEPVQLTGTHTNVRPMAPDSVLSQVNPPVALVFRDTGQPTGFSLGNVVHDLDPTAGTCEEQLAACIADLGATQALLNTANAEIMTKMDIITGLEAQVVELTTQRDQALDAVPNALLQRDLILIQLIEFLRFFGVI